MDERWTSCFTLVGGNIVLSSMMKGLWVICGGWIGQIKSACQTWLARIFIWDFPSHIRLVLIVVSSSSLSALSFCDCSAFLFTTVIFVIVLIFTNHIIIVIIVINGSDDHGWRSWASMNGQCSVDRNPLCIQLHHDRHHHHHHDHGYHHQEHHPGKVKVMKAICLLSQSASASIRVPGSPDGNRH